MRVRFKKFEQKKFLKEVLQNLGCPSIKELINRGININHSTLKNYFFGARLMPEDLYQDLCEMARVDPKSFEVEFVEDNWGRVKGGKKSKK